MADIFELFRKIGSQSAERGEPISWIIAGLGNPGPTYRDTRHNAGFRAIDYLAKRLSVSIDRAKFHSLVGEATFSGARVLLMKPETFMNESGIAIGEAAAFYKIPPENIMVLYDDISFEPGRIRLRRAGSAGGHNGLKSIIAHLDSQDFPRVKIGVGNKPTPEYPLVDWVLGKMSEADKKNTEERYPDIYEAIALWIEGKSEAALNRYSR